jgi:hypothetical protein
LRYKFPPQRATNIYTPTLGNTLMKNNGRRVDEMGEGRRRGQAFKLLIFP